MIKKILVIFLLIIISMEIASAQDKNKFDFYQSLLNGIKIDIDSFEFKKNQLFDQIEKIKKSDDHNKIEKQYINNILSEFKKYKKEYFNLLNENKKLLFKINRKKYNKAYRKLYDIEDYYSLSLKYHELFEEAKIYLKNMPLNKERSEEYKKISVEKSIILNKMIELENNILPVEYSKYDNKIKIINYLDFINNYYDKTGEIIDKINELTFRVIKLKSEIKKGKN